MATKPLTNVLPEGPRKQATSKGRPLLVFNGVHIRTGLPVKDATEPRYITVTDEDAKNATPDNPRLCAFSQCARRTEE